MSETKTLHVTLPMELARLVEAKVASGEYVDESEVVASGLEALVANEDEPVGEPAELERWLREEVVPTYEALRRDPSRAVPFAEAKQRIETHIERKRRENGDA